MDSKGFSLFMMDNYFGARGGNGIALKLKCPKIAACAESDGLRRDEQRRLSVSMHCGRSLSQNEAGKRESQLHKPAMIWFLNVLIALSTALRRCICGGTNWYFTFDLLKDCLMS